uniref:FCH and double SH3 domains 1 n=1 Tax=Chelonoidis abingdonii TaxID=106734 RepID=A0A8C0J0Y2_CHEAB
MQPPPRKVKLTQEVKVRFIEQLSSLQSKQQRETELLEDIRYQRDMVHVQGQCVGEGLLCSMGAARLPPVSIPCRSAFAVWKGAIDSTVCAGQARVAASENYRSLSLEVAKTTRLSKEHLLKKQLQRVQAELLETVKEVGKAKKHYMHLQRVSEVAKEKAADVEARLRKSDHGIFHTKASLQKLSTKFSVQLAEYSQQLVVARNEYLLTLGAANAHLGHYYHVELPAVMKILDGDLYERLRDHLTLVSRTELEACHATQERFRGILEVCREQSLLLFLQDNTAFIQTPEQQFQPSGADQACLLEARSGSTGESGLEKEARRWATRAARDYKIKTHGKQVSAQGCPAQAGCREHCFQLVPWLLSLVQACQSDELSIHQGEELEVIEDGDVEEWVKVGVGQWGRVHDEGGEEMKWECPLPAQQLASLLPRWRQPVCSLWLPAAWLVRALYDYEGQSVEELTFPEGAIIRVLPREEGEVDDGFWKGDFNGRVGVFPSLVVEEITGVIGVAGQELSSPSPPAFSPPVLAPGAGLGSHPLPEVLLGGECFMGYWSPRWLQGIGLNRTLRRGQD